MIRVLLIEDDEDDYVITRDLLQEVGGDEIELDWISDPEQGLSTALERRHNVILVDYRLGRWSGLDIIRAIRGSGCKTPSILLTGEGRDNLDIEALQKGAADYLSKDEISGSLLERSIRYAIERKRSEEVLRESEERFRTLANAVPALIWMAGPDDRLLFVNDGWLNFRGTSLEEEKGKLRGEGGHEDDLERLQEIASAIAAQRSFESEIRLLRHDGEYRWMLNTGTPICLADGTFNGYVGTCIDITERKTASEQLAKARDQALDNAREKSQFLANMTHEIRTPMNGILGMAGLLRQTNLTQDQRELIDSVRASGQSLVRIIDDILDFSRLEARRLTIDRAPFNLLSVVEDVTELLAESARAKGIELISTVDPNIVLEVMGDSGRLRQVLLNLVGNAIKFTDEGDVLLSVSLLKEDRGRITVRMEVRDSGIGIEKETQERLFTAFMQADGSTTRKYGGTGLGLAISKELVELMQGTIGVESRIGHGSVFRIVLRLEKDPDGAHDGDWMESDWTGRKVLVIDDHPEQRAALCRHFSYLGIDCTELAHGAKARQVIEQEARDNVPFAAVFVDADMAIAEAEQTVRSLAAVCEGGEPRIVVMPFGFLNEHIQPLLDAGAADFLPKPIRHSQLCPLLDRLRTPPRDPLTEEVEAPPVAPYLSTERFLILGEADECGASLKQQLESLGGSADLIHLASQAIEALKVFYYDAVFLDPEVMGEATPDVLRQIHHLSVDNGAINKIPIIGLGASAKIPGAKAVLDHRFEPADLVTVLSRCQFLPELPRRGETQNGAKPDPGGPRREAPLFQDGFDSTKGSTGAAPNRTLDLDRLNDLRCLQSNGEDVVRDLLDLFRAEVPARVAELRRALDDEEWAAADFLTQAISGVCGNLGGRQMVALCLRLQEKVNVGSFREVPPLMASIEQELIRFDAALESSDK